MKVTVEFSGESVRGLNVGRMCTLIIDSELLPRTGDLIDPEVFEDCIEIQMYKLDYTVREYIPEMLQDFPWQVTRVFWTSFTDPKVDVEMLPLPMVRNPDMVIPETH